MARRAYYNQVPWKRVAVILAGPGVNMLIAFLLFWVVLFAGSLNGAVTLEGVNPDVRTLGPERAVVEAVERGMPAAGALRPGDRIVAVDGRPATLSTVVKAVSAHRCAGALVAGCRGRLPRRLSPWTGAGSS